MTPEQYWIDRGTDVIGIDVLRDGDKARQAATYKVIADLVTGHYGALYVLDVGCNFGILEMYLRRNVFSGRYLGLDSNPSAIAYGKRIGNHVRQGNLRALEQPDRNAEVVVVKDVLEHLENIQPLREAFRVAWNAVIVSVYIPWTNDPEQIVQHDDGYYTNRYCLSDVIALASECGWTLVQTIDTRETNGTPNTVYVWERVA